MPQRIQYHQYGGPEVLRLEEFTPTQPGEGEVLVRVRAAGANPMDWGIRSGELKMMTGRTFPRGLGHDFAGVVEAVGPGVGHLSVGDEVLGGSSLKAAGAFAELVVAEASVVIPKPANLSFEEAATLPTVGLTAFQALHRKIQIRPGQAVFIHGSLGSVGRAATQLAQAAGASVAGSCRNVGQEARDLGLDPVVTFDFDPTGLAGLFDLVLDTAGTLPYQSAKALLKPGGRIIDIKPTPAKFARSALPGPFRVLMAQPVREDLSEVALAASRGELRLPIARVVPLTQAIAALTELELHGTPKGKLVTTP